LSDPVSIVLLLNSKAADTASRSHNQIGRSKKEINFVHSLTAKPGKIKTMPPDETAE